MQRVFSVKVKSESQQTIDHSEDTEVTSQVVGLLIVITLTSKSVKPTLQLKSRQLVAKVDMARSGMKTLLGLTEIVIVDESIMNEVTFFHESQGVH